MSKENTKIDLTIGENSVINGNLTSKGSVRIDGEVIGDINIEGMIIVGEKGRIKGNITGSEAAISGKIEGNLTFKNYVELTSTAQITGDIQTEFLQIEKGALFNGNCLMGKTASKSKKA